MVAQVAIDRLRVVKSGRGSSRQVITKDWQDLEKINEATACALLAQPLPSSKELKELDIELPALITPRRDISRITDPESPAKKRRRYPTREHRAKMDSLAQGQQSSD